MLPLALALFLGITSFFITQGTTRGIPRYERQVAGFLQELPARDIYTDFRRTGLVLPFYMGYKNTDSVKDVEKIDPGQASDAYILVNRLVVEIAARMEPREVDFPDSLLNPPPDWELLKTFYHGTVLLYRTKQEAANQ